MSSPAADSAAANRLAVALTGLLRGPAGLPAQLYELTGAVLTDAEPGRGASSQLGQALAGHRHAPAELLAPLAGAAAPDSGVGSALIGNGGAPAAVGVRAARLLANTWTLREISGSSSDPDVLTTLAERAAAAPRAKVARRWRNG